MVNRRLRYQQCSGANLPRVFYNCKLFGLRGGDEHRELCSQQFVVDYNAAGRYVRFMGRSSKNVKGGLRQKDVTVKDLKIYAQPQLGDRCMVDVYNLYFGYIPAEGPFYRKPLASNPPKFGSQCIGRNKLAGLMKEMCEKAGLKGNFTNRSGKPLVHPGCLNTMWMSNLSCNRQGTGAMLFKHTNGLWWNTTSWCLKFCSPHHPKGEGCPTRMKESLGLKIKPLLPCHLGMTPWSPCLLRKECP